MNLTEPAVEKPATEPENVYWPSARCDACNAQAFMMAERFIMETAEPHIQDLLFCGHHGQRYRAKLESEGWEILDRRDEINAKQSSAE